MEVMYLVGPGEKEELRYSLRSLRNVDHGDVWIVGWKPDWVTNVHHIPTTTRGNSKYEKLRKDLRMFCGLADAPDVFSYWNDDFFALEATGIPNWHQGLIHGALRHPRRMRQSGSWRDGLIATKYLLDSWGFPTFNYELHVPMVVEKDKMAEIAARAGNQIRSLQLRSLYGNAWNGDASKARDVKASNRADSWKPGQVWVSTNDRSFKEGTVGKRLRELFPDPSPYEKEA